MTLKVITGIHWEAMKLWLKGLPVFSHPEAPEDAVSVVTANRK